MHAHAEFLSCLPLCLQKIASIFRENIMMIKDRRAAIFHQLSHSGQTRQTLRLLGQILPDLIQRDQPVKQFQILHLGQIAGKDLIEMMVRVNQTRICNHTGGVNHTVNLQPGQRSIRSGSTLGSLIQLRFEVRTDLFDDSVHTQKITVKRHGIVAVAGDNCINVLNQKRTHNNLLFCTLKHFLGPTS